MMIKRGSTSRIIRGDLMRPGRYWTAFVISSFVVHIVALAAISGAAESFIQNLPRPGQGQPQVLYVGLVFTGPKAVAARTALPNRVVPVAPAVGRARDKDPVAAVVSRPVEWMPGRSAPPELDNPRPSAANEYEEEPAPSSRPAPRIAIAKTAPAKDGTDVVIDVVAQKRVPSPGTVADKAPPEAAPAAPDFYTSDADRKYVEFFERSDDSVALIRGGEESVIKGSELAKPPALPNLDKPALHTLAGPTAPLSEAHIELADESAQHERTEGPAITEVVEHVQAELREEPLPAEYDGGVAVASLDRAIQYDRAEVYSLFWDVMERYAQDGLMPEPLHNASLAIEHSDPGQVPPPVYGFAPPTFALVTTAKTGTAAIPEPEPRRPPKVIEVADTTSALHEPPEISFTRPAPGDTDKSLVKVSGEAAGEGVTSVLFGIGGSKRELLVTGGVFETDVALTDGRNVLTASASDSFGRTARTRLVINYVPAPEGAIISFITPADGGIIDALETKELEVLGKVEGEAVGQARVYLNRGISDVPVKDGSFRLVTLLDSEDNKLYAEASGKDGKTYRSETVRFRAVNLFPKDITVMVETGGARGVTLTHGWKPHPLDEGQPAGTAPRFIDSVSGDGYTASVEEAGSGIFTVGASYDLPSGESAEAVFHVTLYGHDPARKKTRTLGPFRLSGRGRLRAVRVLLPERVFWEDDYWFSGMIESSSGTTKFKEPEGLSWFEED